MEGTLTWGRTFQKLAKTNRSEHTSLSHSTFMAQQLALFPQIQKTFLMLWSCLQKEYKASAYLQPKLRNSKSNRMRTSKTLLKHVYTNLAMIVNKNAYHPLQPTNYKWTLLLELFPQYSRKNHLQLFFSHWSDCKWFDVWFRVRLSSAVLFAKKCYGFLYEKWRQISATHESRN